MDKRDRAMLGELYDCVQQIGTLTPANPADIATVSRNLRLATSAAKLCQKAIGHLGFGEFRAARERIAQARALLGEEDEHG